MNQLLLFPDSRPLVERLGPGFFRTAPQCPGVYLMRDNSDAVLYVGKAKNLRKRLNSYRVANPDRMPRRQLKLLRAVSRIELQECPDEAAALSKEAELLKDLRPRFNRAGTWSAPPRFLAWRTTPVGFELAVKAAPEPMWSISGPWRSRIRWLHSALVRLLWCALQPDQGIAGMPEGWFQGRHGANTIIPVSHETGAGLEGLERTLDEVLGGLLSGDAAALLGWVDQRTASQKHPFEMAIKQDDLETVCNWSAQGGRVRIPAQPR